MAAERPPQPPPAADAVSPAAAEQAADAEAAVDVGLDEDLRRLRDHILQAFPDLDVVAFRGELTLVLPDPERLPEVLTFCRDDPDVACELLADLSGVHWPGGTREITSQETTGWPVYTEESDGRIEVDYLLRSVRRGHAFRVRVAVPDDAPRLPSAVNVYGSANFMEREVYDFFGVTFEGHPNLARILMPEEWEGHPHRKDYPLGGVEVMYKGVTVPPPDERDY